MLSIAIIFPPFYFDKQATSIILFLFLMTMVTFKLV
jgi:hypothetical protein